MLISSIEMDFDYEADVEAEFLLEIESSNELGCSIFFNNYSITVKTDSTASFPKTSIKLEIKSKHEFLIDLVL
jgi:hypothetical protein